jgi:hypothetical protein
MSARSITFNGFNLQSEIIVTQDIDFESPAEKELNAYPQANSNDITITGDDRPSKTIKIKGQITADNPAALDPILDQFRGYFRGKDKNLDIGYAGSVRRYIATENGSDIKRPGGLQMATFTIEFLCKPFGQDITPQTPVSATGRTAAAYTDNVTLIGSADYQLPIATSTITALTATGNQTVSFGNNNTGQQLSVTRTFAVNDVIVFDCVAKEVRVNGVAVDFAGAFVELEPGLQALGYSDTFTARTYNYNVQYYPRWF